MDRPQAVNPIQRILHNRRTARLRGIYSCCSANAYVLRAAIRRSVAHDLPVLIESTANQVNPFGGYSGMRPADFYSFAQRIADEEGLPRNSLLIGGDHLGPLIWADLASETALENAERLVRECVLAGYVKIHLDASMRLGGDDPVSRLPDQTIARRCARLCAAAERAFEERLRGDPSAVPPVYVVGSEVPVPGGALRNESDVSVTSAGDCLDAFRAFHAEFASAGMRDAWERVVAMVVQPGVEFADGSVVEYRRSSAAQLLKTLDSLEGLVFEGHSTDYQPAKKLREMVEDGVCILKVGPALTFGLREGLFALESIERELAPLRRFEPSCLRETADRAMLDHPAYWEKYYHGTAAQIAFSRAFSFSDRMRYYLPGVAVQAAIRRLMRNLNSVEIPPSLISQYLPRQFAAIRSGLISQSPEELLADRVGDWIDDYLYATTGGNEQ